MKIAITQKQWAVSEKQLRNFNIETIKEMLRAFNQACGGNFYMVDYFHEKIIVDSSEALILCGYSKDKIEKEGFGFYDRILKRDEFDWIIQMNEAGYKLLFHYPKSKRKNLVIYYDLTVQDIDNNEYVLHHKVIPYQLCKNGNMWLGLCYATVSPSVKMKNKACFVNTETGERYKLVNNEFELYDNPLLSSQEMQILKLLVTGLPDKEICCRCNEMPISTFKMKKRQLLQKLEAYNPTNAIHQAHLLGII